MLGSLATTGATAVKQLLRCSCWDPDSCRSAPWWRGGPRKLLLGGGWLLLGLGHLHLGVLRSRMLLLLLLLLLLLGQHPCCCLLLRRCLLCLPLLVLHASHDSAKPLHHLWPQIAGQKWAPGGRSHKAQNRGHGAQGQGTYVPFRLTPALPSAPDQTWAAAQAQAPSRRASGQPALPAHARELLAAGPCVPLQAVCAR